MNCSFLCELRAVFYNSLHAKIQVEKSVSPEGAPTILVPEAASITLRIHLLEVVWNVTVQFENNFLASFLERILC